jgi:carboxypeptidase D
LNSSLGIPLRGSAIGNGWIDARRQYPSFLDYAVKHGLVEPGTAVRLQAMGKSTRAYCPFHQQYERGKKATDNCNSRLNEIEGEPIHDDLCEEVMQAVVNEPGGAEYVPMQSHSLTHANRLCSEKAGRCLNIYDVRLKDEVPACGMNWPLDLKNITSYLQVCNLYCRAGSGLITANSDPML